MRRSFTEQELETIKSLRADNVPVADIAKRLGRDREAVRSKIRYMEMAPDELRELRKQYRESHRRRAEERKHRRHDPAQIVLAERPSEEMLAERDERYSAPFRDLSGFAFGDPPVGYSALDRA